MEDKEKAKMVLLNRLKEMKSKPAQNMPYNEDGGQFQEVRPLPSIAPKMEPKPIARIDTEEDFRKMPYEGKAKYDNELKQLNSLKSENPELVQKPKKMFFEHYDTTEPYQPNITTHTNPSGRPPNIPKEMYQGIIVKPKRPWVFLGTENLPPVEYQEANEMTFRNSQRKTIQDPNEGVTPNQRLVAEGSKPRKKASKRNKDDSGSEDLQSGLQMSDEMEMSGGDSVFASDLRSQSKLNRKSMRNSEINEDDMSEGTETKKRQQSIFNDSESMEGYDSELPGSSRIESRSQRNSKQAKKHGKLNASRHQDWSDEE